jgi:hypothetical protein
MRINVVFVIILAVALAIATAGVVLTSKVSDLLAARTVAIDRAMNGQ